MSRIKQGGAITIALTLLAFACGPSTPDPVTPAPDPYAAYYPQPACDPSQPGCVPAAPPPAYPAPAPAPAPASTMAVPGPLAMPCQADSACLLARCNVQYQKCAFPCQSAADCNTGASCNAMSGLCLPGG